MNFSQMSPEFRNFILDLEVVHGLYSLRSETMIKDFERVHMIAVKQVEEFMKWRIAVKSTYLNGERVILMKLILLSISTKLEKTSYLNIEVNTRFHRESQCKLKSGFDVELTFQNNFECISMSRYELLRNHFGSYQPFTISLEVRIKNFSQTPIQDSFTGFIFNDLINMLDNELFSDVTILVDGGEFKAHRVILAARSPYLRAMLQHEMKEGLSGVIVLEDIDRCVFDELLYYIYSGKVRNLKEHAQQLLVSSAKFCLDNLKAICCDHLERNLTLTSVCELYILSDMYSCNGLKAKSQEFIIANSQKIIHSQAWKNLSKDRPYLMAEICEKLALNKK